MTYRLTYAQAIALAHERSLNGYVQHVNINADGTYILSDWYAGDATVASYEGGRELYAPRTPLVAAMQAVEQF